MLTKHIDILYLQYLADIEDHLNITIQQVENDMKVPSNEFDGKVVYGQKRKQAGSGYQVCKRSCHFYLFLSFTLFTAEEAK